MAAANSNSTPNPKVMVANTWGRYFYESQRAVLCERSTVLAKMLEDIESRRQQMLQERASRRRSATDLNVAPNLILDCVFDEEVLEAILYLLHLGEGCISSDLVRQFLSVADELKINVGESRINAVTGQVVYGDLFLYPKPILRIPRLFNVHPNSYM
jgi:hypothetical protein